MISAVVAAKFRAEWHNGLSKDIVVRVGRPYRAKTGEWVCRAQIAGLGKAASARGEDALQALCLALDLVGDFFYQFRKDGGRIKFYDSAQDVPLQAYFRLREFRSRMKRLSARYSGKKRVKSGQATFRRRAR